MSVRLQRDKEHCESQELNCRVRVCGVWGVEPGAVECVVCGEWNQGLWSSVTVLQGLSCAQGHREGLKGVEEEFMVPV